MMTGFERYSNSSVTVRRRVLFLEELARGIAAKQDEEPATLVGAIELDQSSLSILMVTSALVTLVLFALHRW